MMLNRSEDWRNLYALWLMNGLRSVAEALGARRVSYLEAKPSQVGMHEASVRTTDQILDPIDAALGLRPNFNSFAVVSLASRAQAFDFA
jgi:hypothetical protein